MAIFNEDVTLLAINEMKTREEYARRSFKKKYNFEPDKPGSSKGTITDKAGKKYHVDINSDNTNAELDGPGSKSSHINLNKKFFNLKGSNGSERRDAMLQHEIGHQNLHNRNKDNRTVDPKNRSAEVYKDGVRSYIKDKNGIDIGSDKDIKSHFKTITPHKLRKTIYGDELEDYMKTSKGSKNEKESRDANFRAAKKYEKRGNHISAREFEADRFAANRTSEGALKRAIRDTYRQTRKKFDEEFDKNIKNRADRKELENKREECRKEHNISSSLDYEQRSKALKDPDLRKAKTYK